MALGKVTSMLSADYWFQSNPGPLTTRAWILYTCWFIVFLSGLIGGGWHLLSRQRSQPRTAPGRKSNASAIDSHQRLRRNGYRILSQYELIIGLAGIILVGARLALIPGWSARIWPLLLVGLALSGPLAIYWAHRPAGPCDGNLRLLAFRDVGPPLSLRRQVPLWLLHLAGLGLWVGAAGWAWEWALGLWISLIAVQLIISLVTTDWPGKFFDTRRSPVYIAPLTPLFLAYASGGIHLLLGLRPQQSFPAELHPSISQLWLLPFYFGSVTAAAMLYTVLLDLFVVCRGHSQSRMLTWVMPPDSVGHRRWPTRSTRQAWPLVLYTVPVVLALGSFTWMALELFTHRTHGVTGTDPFGYTQMAVDLAIRGTVLHRFDLFSYVVDLNIAWAPVITAGYHLPLDQAGHAASVWPAGLSVLMALGYGLAGETGLYLTGPVLALIAALVTGWLAVEMSCAAQLIQSHGQDGAPKPARAPRSLAGFCLDHGLAGCFAVFVWATSFEIIDRSLVPMADVAAALFTTLVWIGLLKLRGGWLTIAATPLRPHNSGGLTGGKEARMKAGPNFMPLLKEITGPSWLDSFRLNIRATAALMALAIGIALGLAYDMRYTQLMLVFSISVGVGSIPSAAPRQRVQLLILAGLGALLAALPDIVYRWHVFDSPVANPQARELTHFAWQHIGPTAASIMKKLLHGREFGLLGPFLIMGLLWQWQRDRSGLATLTAGALSVAALQLPYESLRLRDLLPLFPLLVAWTGLGMARIWLTLLGRGAEAKPKTPRLSNMLLGCGFFAALLLPIVRMQPLVSRTWQPHRASFGYVTPAERTALADLRRLTPRPAAIGTHLNGGAVMLYAGRWPFSPGGWTEAAFDCFLARMAVDKLPVYLLDDGPTVRPTIERFAAVGQLRPLGRLDVPLPTEGGSGQLYEVLSGEPGHLLQCDP